MCRFAPDAVTIPEIRPKKEPRFDPAIAGREEMRLECFDASEENSIDILCFLAGHVNKGRWLLGLARFDVLHLPGLKINGDTPVKLRAYLFHDS